MHNFEISINKKHSIHRTSQKWSLLKCQKRYIAEIFPINWFSLQTSSCTVLCANAATAVNYNLVCGKIEEESKGISIAIQVSSQSITLSSSKQKLSAHPKPHRMIQRIYIFSTGLIRAILEKLTWTCPTWQFTFCIRVRSFTVLLCTTKKVYSSTLLSLLFVNVRASPFCLPQSWPRLPCGQSSQLQSGLFSASPRSM